MKMRVINYVIILLLTLFSREVALGDSPFLIPDEIRKEMPSDLREAIKKAEEDYSAVLNGKEPIHAKMIEDSSMADGGTRSYKGDGYTLTIMNRLTLLGGVPGKLHGPIICLDRTSALAEVKVSNVRFVYLKPNEVKNPRSTKTE